MDRREPNDQVYVDLYWIPLGAGGCFVKRNGRVYEWLKARQEGRPPLDLYHSALEVGVPEGRFVIEQAPVPDADGVDRGVVAGGAVGTRAAARLRLFRYEVRRWRDGIIPDIGEAVESPRRVTTQATVAYRVLQLVPDVPTPVWGRDELGTGEMWNSNAIVSWLICRSGVRPETIRLPAGGGAPGWGAGIVAARRDIGGASPTPDDDADASRPLPGRAEPRTASASPSSPGVSQGTSAAGSSVGL